MSALELSGPLIKMFLASLVKHGQLMFPPLDDSLFMSIGSVIRTEGPHNDAWLRARGPPMMLPRQSPLRSMRQ